MDIYSAVDNAVNAGDEIFVGVSGGTDSMVLLHALLAARRTKDFNLHVIHVEHGIRGKQSLKDANFVQNFCKKNAVDCVVKNVDVPSLCAANKQTIEEAARAARYNIFYSQIGKNGRLFLAHNATDQAETVLMHIFRGSGLDGAVGMLAEGNIVRPLLGFTKQQILDFANEHNIKYVQDITNEDTKYARNYIRLQVLPKLQEVYPAVVQNINKFAATCKQAQQVIEQQVNPNWLIELPYGTLLASAALQSSPAVAAKAIKMAYNRCGKFADLTSKHIALVQDMFTSGQVGAYLSLAHGVVCEKRPDGILFSCPATKIKAECDLSLGPNTLPNGEVAEISIVKKPKFDDGSLYFDWHKVPAGSRWRTRRDGDVFAKFGSGSKKLNDYFTDEKMPNLCRDNVIVLANNNIVLLVLGKQISDLIKIDKHTTQIAKVCYFGNRA